ncbi:unnamed protein product [marine sediment metagenome]|uniref:Uncharacterized protein n=1 Tax=marine sediment metagenome TaxID=412755 RepID=X1JQ30_9ZZZZ
MKYLVTKYEDQSYRYEYEVVADSNKSAEGMVRSGDCEPIRQEPVDSETISIELEEIKEG